MTPFATIEDLNLLWRPVRDDEEEKAIACLEIVSNSLRVEADKVGKDLDQMIQTNPALRDVAKSVTCDVVGRILMTSTDSEPMTQTAQTALGYTFSGSYLVPGGGVFIKKAELDRLGLRRQRIGSIDMMGD